MRDELCLRDHPELPFVGGDRLGQGPQTTLLGVSTVARVRVSEDPVLMPANGGL